MDYEDYIFAQKLKRSAAIFAFVLSIIVAFVITKYTVDTISGDIKDNTHIVHTEVLRKYEKMSEGLFGAKTEYMIEIEVDEKSKTFAIKKESYDQLNINDKVIATIQYNSIDSIMIDRGE